MTKRGSAAAGCTDLSGGVATRHRDQRGNLGTIARVDIAELVRGFLPDVKISFDKATGGKDSSGNYLIDNTRLVLEFGMQYRPYRERVLQIINDIRKEEGLPELTPR